MKITIEPTAEFFNTDDGYPVRLWTGTTDKGTRVLAFVAAICAPAGTDHNDLQAELVEIPGPQVGQVLHRDGWTP